jgi:response regulator RpfG family c-di-GMP phosphodiesterase
MASAKSQTPLRVLFVDDEQALLKAFQRALYGENVALDLSGDPVEALEMVAAKQYDVVAVDFRMPRMNGIEFIKRVRQHQPDTTCILVSGEADFDTVVAAVNEASIFRLLRKPWDSNELRITIRNGAEHARLRRENDAMRASLEQRNRDLDLQVQERSTSLLVALTNALDLRDSSAQWHSRRVALLARRVAQAVGLREAELIEIERGALLHDIGTIGVRDAILLKKESLTEEEQVEMRAHVAHGERLLKHVDFLGRARLVVSQHHERWDGSGYPRRMHGEEIYVGARVFAVADAYEAVRRHRPPQEGRSHAAAVEELRKGAGRQFDPAVVEAFLSVGVDELEAVRERARVEGTER